MQCNNPIWLDSKKLMVPCMKCRGCRIRRSAEWTLRLTHELHIHSYNACFVTLTYDNFWIPFNGTLLKEDLQKFFKKLRKRIKPRKIKYYACGEYGDKSYRPHYHAIIIGLSNSNAADRVHIMRSWPYCDWDAIMRSPGGKKAIGTVTPDSIRYVADYIHKKYSNKSNREMFRHYGLKEQEFQLCSQGIGKNYAESQKQMYEKTGKLYWKGKEIGLPRYYYKKLEVPEDVREANRQEALDKQAEKYELDKGEKIFYDYTWVRPPRVMESQKQTDRNQVAKGTLYKKPI